MNDPAYRKQGLPLTSSLMESTIKQINIRMKGSEKFFGKATCETLLHLPADSINHSRPSTTSGPAGEVNKPAPTPTEIKPPKTTNRWMPPAFLNLGVRSNRLKTMFGDRL